MTVMRVRTAVVLPMAAVLSGRLPRTAAEARRWCAEANAAARAARARRDTDHRARVTELGRQTEAAKAEQGTLGRGRRPPAVRIDVRAIYRALNTPAAPAPGRHTRAALALLGPVPAAQHATVAALTADPGDRPSVPRAPLKPAAAPDMATLARDAYGLRNPASPARVTTAALYAALNARRGGRTS